MSVGTLTLSAIFSAILKILNSGLGNFHKTIFSVIEDKMEKSTDLLLHNLEEEGTPRR